MSPVYPGHAMVLALQAIGAFNSAQEALAESTPGCPALVSSSAVEGAGDGAYAASHLIRKIWTGQLDRGAAVRWAHGEWVDRVGPGAGNHEDQFIPGLEQAAQLQQVFLSACLQWDWSHPPIYRIAFEVTFEGYQIDLEGTSTEMAVAIIDEMTDGLRDVILHPPGDRGTGAKALDISWRTHTRPEADQVTTLAAAWFRQKGWSVLSTKITTEPSCGN